MDPPISNCEGAEGGDSPKAQPAAGPPPTRQQRRAAPQPSGHYPPIDPPIATIISRGTASYPATVPRRRQDTGAAQKASRTLVPLESHPLGPGRAACLGEIEDAKAGTLYIGQVLAGQPHGQGREYIKSIPALNEVGYFLAYSGSWVRGVKSGQGTIFGVNGETYTGEVVEGRRHGLGRMRYLNGDCYEGGWRQGARSGRGQFTRAVSGDVFVGRYEEDRRQGPGTLYMVKRGKKYLAEFVDDEPKCGIWEDVTADELALLTGHDAQDMLSSLRASKHHIPALELDCPFEVLAGRVQELRQQASPQASKAGSGNSCTAPPKAALTLPAAVSSDGSWAGGSAAAGAPAQAPLSGLELEAVRLAAAWEVAGEGASLGEAVLGEEQLRRIDRRLQEMLGPRAAVACQVVASLLGTEDVSGGAGIKYSQLLAAACGAGGTSKPSASSPMPCKRADSVPSSPAAAVA